MQQKLWKKTINVKWKQTKNEYVPDAGRADKPLRNMQNPSIYRHSNTNEHLGTLTWKELQQMKEEMNTREIANKRTYWNACQKEIENKVNWISKALNPFFLTHFENWKSKSIVPSDSHNVCILPHCLDVSGCPCPRSSSSFVLSLRNANDLWIVAFCWEIA